MNAVAKYLFQIDEAVVDGPVGRISTGS